MTPTVTPTVPVTSLPAFEPGTLMSTAEASCAVTDLLAAADETAGGCVTTVDDTSATVRPTDDLAVLFPADANETVACWRLALRRRPRRTVLALSRDRTRVLGVPPAEAIAGAGYRIARDDVDPPEVVLLGTGAAVPIALAAAGGLVGHGLASRVLSVPWPYRFTSAAAVPPGVPWIWVDRATSSADAVRDALSCLRATRSAEARVITCRTS